MKSVTHIECESVVCVLFAAASDQEMVHTYNGLSDVSSQPKITRLCLVYQTTDALLFSGGSASATATFGAREG